MTIRCAWAAALLLVPAIAFARLDASVDTTTISAADTIRLTLRADGANLTGDPDLATLSAHAKRTDGRSSGWYMVSHPSRLSSGRVRPVNAVNT